MTMIETTLITPKITSSTDVCTTFLSSD